MAIVNYQAAIRKLEATLVRQLAAVEATRAQIELFQELIEKASQAQLDLLQGGRK